MLLLNLICNILPCLQVNDDLLVKIASRRQNITELNISDCRGVHDHGVSSLASHCPSLQKYTAYRCKQLGDSSLSALAAHCPLLVKVHVGNQDKLTDEALKKVPIRDRIHALIVRMFFYLDDIVSFLACFKYYLLVCTLAWRAL